MELGSLLGTKESMEAPISKFTPTNRHDKFHLKDDSVSLKAPRKIKARTIGFVSCYHQVHILPSEKRSAVICSRHPTFQQRRKRDLWQPKLEPRFTVWDQWGRKGPEAKCWACLKAGTQPNPHPSPHSPLQALTIPWVQITPSPLLLHCKAAGIPRHDDIRIHPITEHGVLGT